VRKPEEETADDKLLGKTIATTLRAQLKGAASGCPDAETLAAFYDRALTERERAVWAEHFLACLRCQEYLAELARLSDADEPRPLVEADAATAKAAEASWYFRLAWVAPFLIIALASALWFREDIERVLQRSQEMAMKTAEPAPVSETPAAAREGDVTPKPEAARRPTQPLPAKATPPVAPSSKLPRMEPEGRQAAMPAAAAVDEIAAPPGTMVMPSRRAVLRDKAMAAEPSPAEGGEEKKAQDAAPAAAPALAGARTAAPTAAIGPSFARQEAAELRGLTIQGAQPRFTPKWRVGAGGSIQRADEAGGWVRVPSGVSDDLFDITFAGAAGWAVGQEGTVLRSTDGGNTWSRVSPPTSEDLIRVSAQSDQQARVISRSGQSFTTTDGGRTWK